MLESSGNAGQRALAADALGEILRADPATPVAADTFREMMWSGTWTDRNKGSLVLWGLTQGRNATVGTGTVGGGRAGGGDGAVARRMVLGRIAGLPEEGLGRVAAGDADAFFAVMGC